MIKKTALCSIMVLVLALVIPFALSARDVDPIVSTDWLEKNLTNPKVTVIDIRKVEEYKEGHIPNAINVIYGSWAVMKAGIRNELPPTDDLFDLIGSAGIGADSIVVVVGKADNLPNRTDVSRVAWTLKYAGIQNVAILDGGYDKWLVEKKAVSREAFKAKSKSYQEKANENLFVKKDYVKNNIGKVIIVDVREPEFFEGKKKLDFVSKTGRIKGALNLPTSKAFKNDGTYKSKDELAALVAGVIGKDTSKEIIVYCDTGKVCTAWAYVMTEILGYKNVKDYDGSTEEWMKDPNAPIEP